MLPACPHLPGTCGSRAGCGVIPGAWWDLSFDPRVHRVRGYQDHNLDDPLGSPLDHNSIYWPILRIFVNPLLTQCQLGLVPGLGPGQNQGQYPPSAMQPCSHSRPFEMNYIDSLCNSFGGVGGAQYGGDPGVHKGIFWAGIGGCVRIGGPAPCVAGPGAAGATVTGVVRAERPPGGGRAGGAGRGVRRTEAAGVWRERWRSAMRVPRRGRG